MSAQVSVHRSRRKSRVDRRRSPGSSGSSAVSPGGPPVSMTSWRVRRARDSWAMPRRVTGVLVMVTAVGLAACGGSSNGAASTGSPSAPTTTAAAEQFTSNENPYRVTLTEDWTTIPAIEKWTPTTELSLFIQSFDRFDDGKGRILHVGAARVPKSTSLQQWRDSIIAATPSSCSNSSVSQSTLGREPAARLDGVLLVGRVEHDQPRRAPRRDGVRVHPALAEPVPANRRSGDIRRGPQDLRVHRLTAFRSGL